MQMPDPLQTMVEIERIKAQRLELEVKTEELRRLREQNSNAVAPPVPIASAESLFTKGLPNARMWKLWSDQEKVLFISGYIAGVGMSAAISQPVASANLMPANSTNLEIAKALDGFFVDVQNERLPIAFGLPILARRAAGNDKDQLESDLKAMRSWAAAPDPPKL